MTARAGGVNIAGLARAIEGFDYDEAGMLMAQLLDGPDAAAGRR